MANLQLYSQDTTLPPCQLKATLSEELWKFSSQHKRNPSIPFLWHGNSIYAVYRIHYGPVSRVELIGTITGVFCIFSAFKLRNKILK